MSMHYFSLAFGFLLHCALCVAKLQQTVSVDIENIIDGSRFEQPHENSIPTLHQNDPLSINAGRNGPFRRMFRNGDLNIEATDTVDPGKPLFLTPLIEAGKIEVARSLSRVRMGHRFGHSFSGYFTVNKKYNSNMFFWFFPARAGAATAPVVLWLQGGPGGSSLFGLFAENGPFFINKDYNIVPRNYSWNNNHNVIYIDNPVGTGFSFTENDAGYATNEADVGENLYQAMTQFYKLFPGFGKNELYITGESYAGKYVPALSYTIHKKNPTAPFKMNLKGMAIGDGLCDPVTMTDYGDFLYQIGLLDRNERQHFKDQSQLAVQFIKQKEWKKAFLVFDSLLNGDTIDSKSYFYNVTGLSNYYNFLMQNEPKDESYWEKYINKAKIRKEIHVGNLTFNDGRKVEHYLIEDVMKSVKPWIEEILRADIYRVLLYNGQLDIIIASPLTDNFVNTLEFQYAGMLYNATRRIWRVDGEVAGYVKEVPNFAQVVVRDAGHLVPYDQPKWAYDMISRFTQGKRFI